MKQKLFTCLVIFFFATTLSATITYELNGGITNDYGWQSKNDMFQACMADCGITTLPSLDELKAPGVDGLSQICTPFNQSACQTILDNPKWDWLEAYIMLVQNADVTTPATQLTEGVASGGWRYAVAAFFLESQRTSWPRSADFSQAGKVEVFMPYWKHGFDNPTNPSKEVELNIPYNEGETFEGWYMQADFSGEQVTKVDTSTTGTLYAKWTDNVSSVHIYPNDASMGSVSRSGIYPHNSEITISATPNLGYHFVQWSDGNTDAIRTLVLTQDTVLIAEFAQSFSGQCGDNLYWSYDETTKTISISGSGEMYDYTADSIPWLLFREQIVGLTTSNTVTSIGSYAFYKCPSLTSVTIGESVTSIGNYAFYKCSSLTSVTIPNSVTSIGEDAFYGCSSLTSVIIGESVTSIGKSAFDGCSSLTSVTIPNSVTSIGDGAFIYCSSLTSVTIGESVTSIGNYAFDDCSSVTSVTIPNSITSIGYGAFWGCSSLTSVTIPNSVTSIGNYTFSDCSSLTSVTIPNSVTSIGNSAFDGCSSLTSVTIPNSVTSIGKSAFYECSSLTSVTIGESVTSIEDNAFYGCSSLTSVTINSDAIVNSNISRIFGSQVTEYIIGESVTSIGNYAFSDCSSLTSVTIPNSVTSIGDRAFYGCSSLTSVIIPNSVTSIGGSAFYGCSSLTSVTIPNGVTSIGDFTFNGCSSLTSITIPESVTSIGNQAFGDCSSLTSITIPESVTSIGERAFWGCSKLTSPVYNAHCFAYMPTSYSGAYTIPEGIKQIAGSAFKDCKSLTSITIPNSVTSIGSSAFNNCSSLTSVTINSDAIMSKGYSSDSNLSHIFGSQVTEYIIGDSVTSIGDKAFYNCSSLTSVAIGESVTSIGIEAFKGCSKLTSMIIPNSVTSIGTYAFYNCSSLTSVTIPNGVTRIGDHTFAYCSLTSVTIPNSVTSIGDYAFWGCSSLTSITCEATTPPTIGTSAFASVSKSIPVYVPCGCVKAYKAASRWKDFTNIQVPLAKYSIEVYVNDTIMGTAKVDYNTFCGGNQISATPNIGYHFVQWSDGNTDAIRTLELTQDTILTAEFAQSFSGQCGDSLYWELVDTTLHITGKGEMYDYESNTIPWKLLVSSIKSLSVSEGTTSIGGAAFLDCSSLTSITIPNSVTSIGKDAFYNCSSLTSVTIPNSVTSIGNSAFEGCSSLTSITIPNSVTSIGDEAFSGCSVLESVVWNAKNCANPDKKEEAPFFDICSQITSFTFGENVEHIPAYLCDGMDKLTSVATPNSLNTIGISAFEGCARLGKISLGTGLEEIAANAFAGCTRLYDIYTYATYPPFAEESSFANYNAYLYIPCESKRDYTMDPVWSKFQNIECLSDEPITGVENIDTPSQATTNCEKIIRNGQLIIIRDGKTYNAMGQEM